MASEKPIYPNYGAASKEAYAAAGNHPYGSAEWQRFTRIGEICGLLSQECEPELKAGLETELRNLAS